MTCSSAAIPTPRRAISRPGTCSTCAGPIPPSRRALALAAGRRAESIFRTLVREYPDHFDFAYQLSLVQDELGQRFTNAEQWHEAIAHFEEAHQTLKEMAGRHGNLVSRMAQHPGPDRRGGYQLAETRMPSDPVKYAAASRELAAEAYEICDKLSLVQPLSWNSRVAYAITSFALADYQAEDGLSPDLELIRKAERLWEQAGREAPTNLDGQRGISSVVRRRLAEELADRGHRDEAAGWYRQSLETARGNAELLYLLAVDVRQERRNSPASYPPD